MTLVLKNKVIVAMEQDIEIVEIGTDPFGRGEPTVFYRDYNVDYGLDVFYLWVEHWAKMYPSVPLTVSQ